MTIYLGENIKRLRRENELTQEMLADFLGVTFQTVSNWERGESYPDITILPEIASFFRVSVDELLGMNESEAQIKIQEYLDFYDKMKVKDAQLTFEKFQQAVKDFPSDFRILVRYMEILMYHKNVKDNPDYENDSRKIISIYENIQKHCTDDSIRMWSKRLICEHLHSKAYFTGNNEYQIQAEKILSGMPCLIDTKDYLSTMLISDMPKHYEACSNLIENTLTLLNNTVSHYCYYDENFSAEYKIEAIKKIIEIGNIIYTDGNYGKLWLNMIYNYGHLGRFYFSIGDKENALKNLRMSAVLAGKYDDLPDVSERAAQFFEGMHYEKAHRGKTMRQRMKYLMTEKYPLSDDFKSTTGFREILSLLE